MDWDGTVYCENIKYLGTKPSDGTTVININDNFYVTASGGAGGSSANFGTGYFGGGYFGGSAARVNPNGAGTTLATVDANGTIGSSSHSSGDISYLYEVATVLLADILTLKHETIAGLKDDISTLQQQMSGDVASGLLSDISGVSGRLDLIAYNYGKHYHTGTASPSGDSIKTGTPKTS